MNNRESLAHALQGEAKREYNKRYYEQNADYWVEYRNKHNNALTTGSTGTMSGTAGLMPSDGASDVLRKSKGAKTKAEQLADNFMAYLNEKKSYTDISGAAKKMTQLNNAAKSRSSKFYSDYYKPENVSIRNAKTRTSRGGSSIYIPGYKAGVQSRIDKANERLAEEQAKRIRIRDRIASVYKLEWAEAQERAKRLPNRIINSVKNTISNVASSFVEAIRLGKK